MVDTMLLWVAYGAVVGVLSCLVSESTLFAPIREWIQRPLVYCPICLGFWFAMPMILTDGWLPYFATVAFSNLWMLVILKVYRELDEASDAD